MFGSFAHTAEWEKGIDWVLGDGTWDHSFCLNVSP